MNWENHIHSDPQVLLGKPVIRGTRLSVEFILGLLAQGWPVEDIQKNYPAVTHEVLHAVFGFTAACMRDEAMYPLVAEKVS